MNPNLSRRQIEAVNEKRKKKLYLATAGALCYLLFLFLFGEVNLPHYLAMLKSYQQMKNDIHQLSSENASLKKEADALRSDPEQIESLARQQLDLTKEGEIIYEFPRSETSAPSNP
jgi:cell division protein FtsB